MKHKNLEILKQNGINVPHFVVVHKIEEYTPIISFLLKDDVKYAIRSSASVEDGTDYSFAGQFKTLLNVNKQEIKESLAVVFSNLETATQYVQKNNKGEDNAVIIQEMIDADMSGIIFTSNPDGLLNETVIVVGTGLGEGVVDDNVSTTTYFYNQDDDLYYYEQQENAPLLTNQVLCDIIDVSKKIKNIFKRPMDIEFAIKGNVVYILQARPITTLRNELPVILDNSNIVESYPGVSLPLTQSFVKEIYHEIFFNLVTRVTKNKLIATGMDRQLQDMVDIANWRVYYRISNWYAVLKLLPFSKKIVPMWQEMMGVNNEYVQDICSVPPNIKFTTFRSLIYYLINTPKLMDELNKKFDKKYEEYRQDVQTASDVANLLNVYQKIKEDILVDWDITLVNDMYAFIYTALAGKKNKEYISDIKNLGSMRPVIGLNALVLVGKEYGMTSKEYMDASAEYIEAYGDRCLEELKMETKTYRSNPELLDEYVLKVILNDESIHIPINFSKEKNNGFFVKKAKLGIKNREISRLNRSKIYGISRAIFRKIGGILHREGIIESADDVFYLYIHELSKVPENVKELIKTRKKYEKNMQSIPAYSRLVFDEKVFDKKMNGSNVEVLNEANELHGTITSTGKVSGEVIVIESPNDKIDTTDKIVVAKSTDPGWVFLIQNAKGIIAEKGSLLSHTAIISRELHKPAIVNVKDATRLLKTGDVVTLDAEKGIITIEKEK